MKAIMFTSANHAELIEKEMPIPEKGQVLVKLVVSTISSGTERANLTGEQNVSWNPKECEEIRWPRQGGYSSSGIIVKVGEGVESVREGDRVAIGGSAHQQYIAISEKNVYKIENPNITFEAAALWFIGTFPMAAIRKCRLEFGESAIVMGQGVLGQFAVQYLRAAGAVPVIAVDPSAEKRERAMKIGADYAFDPNDPKLAQKVKKITNGGAKVAIEVTGVGKALDQVLDCVAEFGRVALLGCTRHSDFTINYYHKVHSPGITLIGAHTRARPAVDSYGGWWTERDDMNAELIMHSYGRIDLSTLVEETHSPVEAPEVYARLAAGGPFPLVQYDWRLMDAD